MIFCDYGPAVGKLTDVGLAGVYHGFDGEYHSGLDFKTGTRLAIMQYLRIFMEFLADAMPTELAYDTEAVALRANLYGMAYIPKPRSRFHGCNATPHAFECNFA